jgi:hypothetical protein
MTSLKEEIDIALGHACVPFSTDDEAKEGFDALILFFLEGAKAVISSRKSDLSPGILLLEILGSLHQDTFIEFVKRLEDTVSMIEVYKVGTIDQRRQVLPELKKRNIL